MALAVLLTAMVCAESFNEARATLALLYDRTGSTRGAAPAGLATTWLVVAAVGLAAGLYVAARFVSVATELHPDGTGGNRVATWLRAHVAWFAYSAVAVWVAWQLRGAFEVAHPEDAWWLTPWLHGLAIFLAVVAVAAGGSVPGSATEAWERASVVRVQLLFLAVLFVVVFVAPISSDQIVDVLRAWGDGPASTAVAGIAAALLLGAVLRASASRLLLPDTRPAAGLTPTAVRSLAKPIERPSLTPDRIVAGVCAGLALIFLLAPGLEAAAILAGGIAVLALATKPIPPDRLARREGEGQKAETDRVSLRRLSNTLGVIPLGILLTGLVAALVGSLLLPSGPSTSDKWLIFCTVAVVVLFGLLAARAHGAPGTPATSIDEPTPAELVGGIGFFLGLATWLNAAAAAWGLLLLAGALAFRAFGQRGAREVWGGWGVTLGVGLAVYFDPIGVSRSLGAFALTLFGATGAMALLHMAGSVGIRRQLRRDLRGHVFAAPVVLLLLVWALGASYTAPEEAHQARTVAEPEKRTVSLETAVGAWLDRQPVPADGGYVPMLIVGASGGGSKAAYWTDLVLDCILGRGAPVEGDDECRGAGDKAAERYPRLFLTSSVSGGSVGIHHLLNHEDKAGAKEPWISATAGREVLSPVVGWGMFHDLPAFLLGLPTDPSRCEKRLGCPFDADRALVQEAAIGVFGDGTAANVDDGLLGRSGPVTVFNGAVTKSFWRTTGQRVLVSRAALAPPAGCASTDDQPAVDAIDGHDLLPGQDIPLVTAAMLSARFPLVEPSARVGTAKDASPPEGCDAPHVEEAVRRLSDGGLHENTGLATIAQLLPGIRRSIDAWKAKEPGRSDIDVRPIVLSIDDDVLHVTGDTEYASGLDAIFEGEPDRRSIRVRKRLRGCNEFRGVAFRRISPTPHVGAQAATGWAISETSRREDLGESLRSREGTPNDGVQEIRDMLDGAQRPTCSAVR